MNNQKTIKTKLKHCKTGAKNNHKQKHKYFAFVINDKKWQDIYTFIIK